MDTGHPRGLIASGQVPARPFLFMTAPQLSDTIGEEKDNIVLEKLRGAA
jgi:hypothetical protein